MALGRKLKDFYSSGRTIEENAKNYRIPGDNIKSKNSDAIDTRLSSKGPFKPATNWSIVQIREARKIKLR